MGIDTVYEQDMQTAHIIQPAEEMGRQAVAILLDMLSGGSRQRHVRLEATLRRGGSVRPL